MRHIRQSEATESSTGVDRVSPQRAHAGPLRTGNSVQQTSQMGTEERCGRGEPQRAQEAGSRAQPIAFMGLRSTRATARQREVSDGGTSNVSEPESLRKTHLTLGRRWRICRLDKQYTRTGRNHSIVLREFDWENLRPASDSPHGWISQINPFLGEVEESRLRSTASFAPKIDQDAASYDG